MPERTNSQLVSTVALCLRKIALPGLAWLFAIYLDLNAMCEGFGHFIVLMPGGGITAVAILLLAISSDRSAFASSFSSCSPPCWSCPQAHSLSVEYHFAEQDLKVISTALNRYRSDHGVYPESLSALQPRHLSEYSNEHPAPSKLEPYFRSHGDTFYLSAGAVCGPRIRPPQETAAAGLPLGKVPDAGAVREADAQRADAAPAAAMSETPPTPRALQSARKPQLKPPSNACLERCRQRNRYTDCMGPDGMVPCPCHCP